MKINFPLKKNHFYELMVTLRAIDTHAPNVYYSTAENSLRQTHNLLLFQ